MCEIEAVSGAETITYSLPAGSTVTTRLEANQSTSITVNIPGYSPINWNSGVALACFITGTGFGMTAGVISGNPTIGTLTGLLVSKGCSKLISADQPTPPSSSDDGD